MKYAVMKPGPWTNFRNNIVRVTLERRPHVLSFTEHLLHR